MYCTVFLPSYRNTSESLGEKEMLWEHEPQASVSTAFSSPPSFTSVPITGVLDRNTYNMFLFLLENTVAQKTKRTCLH